MHLYQVIVVSVITILVGLPLSAQASQIQPGLASTYTISTNSENSFNRGTNKILLKDYGGAIKDLHQAIRNNPDDPKAHINQGLARAILGDKQGAITDFNQALQLNPDLAEAYYNRGFVRSELQDYLGAKADFDQALHLSPEDADACHCRGVVRYRLGDWGGAIADLRSAADLYLKQGRIDAYRDILNQLSKLHLHPVALIEIYEVKVRKSI